MASSGLFCVRTSIVEVVLIFAATLQLNGQVLPFHTYSTKDGLPSNRILTMTQDSRGYLWIGTPEGVSVFDGVTFRNYGVESGLGGSYVTSIAESKSQKGVMWVGTLDGGLSRFDRGVFRKVPLDTSSTRVFSLMEDKDGVLWCGTNGFVLHVRNDSVTRFEPKVIPRGETQILISNDSVVYILSRSALFLYARRTKSLDQILLPLKSDVALLGLNRDANGDVWLSSSDEMVFRLQGPTIVEREHVGGIADALVLRDNDDELWFGGVFRVAHNQFNHGKPIHYTKENGLPGDNIYPLMIDNESNIWFGSWDNGIIKLAEKGILRFPGKLYDSKTAVVVDDRGRLWGLAFDGVNEYWRDPDGAWHQALHVLRSAGFPVLNGSTGAFARGLLWIMCNDGTIKGYKLHVTSPFAPSALTPVRTIAFHDLPRDIKLNWFFADRDSNFMCVCGNILRFIDTHEATQTVQTVAPPAVPSNIFANAFLKDHHGDVWIGDYSLGLFKLKQGGNDSIVQFTTGDGLPDNSIRSIVEDSNGRILVGTRYGGIAVFENGMFTTISVSNGLLSNHVRSMALDSKGRVWLGTSRGPMYFDGQGLHHVGWNNELFGTQISACGVHPEGFLWFATSNGLTIYDPSKRWVSTSPPVHITNFTVNGQPFDIDRPRILSHDENNCVIEYVGISFRDEAAVRYQYRLGGGAWSAPTSQRSITFAGLNPGSYKFEVRAINALGVASDIPAELSFSIAPPFWRRWWFVGGSVLVLFGAFGSVVRYVSTQRLRRKVHLLEREQAVQLEREKTRDRIARDLHDDVASTLGSVVIYAESLKRQVEPGGAAPEIVNKISAMSLEAQEAIGDIVWSTSPAHDTLKELLVRFRDVTSDLCSTRGMGYEIDFPGQIPDVILTDEVRKSLLLIFKEALNNILKHSGAKGVRIAVSLDNGEVRLVMADDGKGFAISADVESGRGHGLRNMSRRATEIGARFTITSSPGGGTSVEVVYRMT